MTDYDGIAQLITALVALIGLVVQGVRYIRAHARAELLQEQSVATMEAKDREIAELTAENQQLWALLSEVTTP